MLSDPFVTVRLLASSRLAQLALRMRRLCMWRGGVPLFVDGEATGDFGISRGAVKKQAYRVIRSGSLMNFVPMEMMQGKSQMLKTWRDKRYNTYKTPPTSPMNTLLMLTQNCWLAWVNSAGIVGSEGSKSLLFIKIVDHERIRTTNASEQSFTRHEVGFQSQPC